MEEKQFKFKKSYDLRACEIVSEYDRILDFALQENNAGKVLIEKIKELESIINKYKEESKDVA